MATSRSPQRLMWYFFLRRPASERAFLLESTMKRFLNILIDTMVGNRNGELSDGIEVAIGFFSAIGIGCLLELLVAWAMGVI